MTQTTITQLIEGEKVTTSVESGHVAVIEAGDYAFSVRVEKEGRLVGIFASCVSLQNGVKEQGITVTGSAEDVAKEVERQLPPLDAGAPTGDLPEQPAVEETPARPESPEAVGKMKLPELKQLAAFMHQQGMIGEVKGNKPDYVAAIVQALFPSQPQEQAQEAPQAPQEAPAQPEAPQAPQQAQEAPQAPAPQPQQPAPQPQVAPQPPQPQSDPWAGFGQPQGTGQPIPQAPPQGGFNF